MKTLVNAIGATVVGSAAMTVFGAVWAAIIMLFFNCWHSVQPQIPAFGYLQVWFPLLIAESVITFLAVRTKGVGE